MEVMDGSANTVFLRSSSGSPTRPFLFSGTLPFLDSNLF